MRWTNAASASAVMLAVSLVACMLGAFYTRPVRSAPPSGASHALE